MQKLVLFECFEIKLVSDGVSNDALDEMRKQRMVVEQLKKEIRGLHGEVVNARRE